MSILDGVTDDSGYVRDPDDFLRLGKDGPPRVSSLTKTRLPQGKKAELIAKCESRGIVVPAKVTVKELKALLGREPAFETYGRPSSFGEGLGGSYNLIKWKERQVVDGIAADPGLLSRLDGVSVSERKNVLDRIVSAAHDAAGSDLASERGTAIHLLTEWAEQNRDKL